MPFASKKQKRFLYSQKPKIAKEFAEKTPKNTKLPEKKKATKKAKKTIKKKY